MEDAYEIGIRLVLENGVSAGIAVLQKDLAAYDRALAATTGRQRMLAQAAGAGGRGVAPPAGAGGAGPVAPGPAGVVETAVAEVAPGRRGEGTMVVPPAPAQPPARVAAPAMPRVTVAGQSAGPPEGALRSLPAAPGQPAQAAAGRGLAPATVLAVPPVRYARYAPAAPAAPSPAGQPPTGQPPIGQPVTVQVPSVAAPEVADSKPVPPPAPAQPAARQAPLASGQPARSPGLDVVPPAAASAAPAPAQAANAPAVLARPAAPVAAAASAGPVQGDVFLDGTRVGRWMSDRLAREADRPQSGMTGFDPRLGPAWPGSLHGT